MGLTLRLAHLPVFMLPPTDFSQWWFNNHLLPCLSSPGPCQDTYRKVLVSFDHPGTGRPLLGQSPPLRSFWAESPLPGTSYVLPDFPGRLPQHRESFLRICPLEFYAGGGQTRGLRVNDLLCELEQDPSPLWTLPFSYADKELWAQPEAP